MVDEKKGCLHRCAARGIWWLKMRREAPPIKIKVIKKTKEVQGDDILKQVLSGLGLKQ